MANMTYSSAAASSAMASMPSKAKSHEKHSELAFDQDIALLDHVKAVSKGSAIGMPLPSDPAPPYTEKDHTQAAASAVQRPVQGRIPSLSTPATTQRGSLGDRNFLSKIHLIEQTSHH